VIPLLGSYVSGHTSWAEIKRRRLTKVAHDPGDMQITSHCPFCGSGQVIGRSDGNIECEFCGMAYLVRVQPAFTGMPQQPAGPGFGGPSSMQGDLMDPGMIGPDGLPMDPGMEEGELGPGGEPLMEGDEAMGPDGEPLAGGPLPPGTDGGEGLPPGMEEGFPPGGDGGEEDDGEDAPPWAKDGNGGDDEGKADKNPPEDSRKPPKDKKNNPKKAEGLRTYRTVAGDLLPEDAYMRHLACLHGGIEAVKLQHVEVSNPYVEHVTTQLGHDVDDIAQHFQEAHNWGRSDIGRRSDERLRDAHEFTHRRNHGLPEHYVHQLQRRDPATLNDPQPSGDEFRYTPHSDPIDPVFGKRRAS
jgi:hypothetical protein